MTELKTDLVQNTVVLPFEEAFNTLSPDDTVQLDAPEDRTIHSIEIQVGFPPGFYSLADDSDVFQAQLDVDAWLGGSKPVPSISESFEERLVSTDTRSAASTVQHWFLSRQTDEAGASLPNGDTDLLPDVETMAWDNGQTLNLDFAVSGFQDVLGDGAADFERNMRVRIIVRYTEGGSGGLR